MGSEKEKERAGHHHATCYASEKHYWAPIARRSLVLGVKLHAAAHDGYSLMYTYIRSPSAKKPVPEIGHSLCRIGTCRWHWLRKLKKAFKIQ